MFRKNKLAMLVGEFLGTMLLTLVVLGVLRSQAGGFFVALGAGVVLAMLTVALGGISGAVFNPAISVALWSVRKLRALQAVSYIIVQFAGAFVAWYLFVYLTKLDTSLVQHDNIKELAARPLLAEAVGAFVFAFAIAAAVYQRFRLSAKALTVGSGLTIGAWIASLASAAFLNPAVAAALQQWNIFTYMVAPVLGAVLGMNLYNLLFVTTEVAEAEEAALEVREARVETVKIEESMKAAAPKKAATTKTTGVKKTPVKKTVAKKKTPAKKK